MTRTTICTGGSKHQRVAGKLRPRSRSMMAPVMNRLLRPFGLKLGPLQAGAIYFPLHFFAVGIGLKLLIVPQGVGIFWPATGSLFAFLLLYPPRNWLALLGFAFAAELSAHEVFAQEVPYTVAGLLFFVKFLAGVS